MTDFPRIIDRYGRHGQVTEADSTGITVIWLTGTTGCTRYTTAQVSEPGAFTLEGGPR